MGEGKQEQEQESEEGASSPFYIESGTPGYCQVTVGWSVEELPTTHAMVKVWQSEDMLKDA